MPRPTPRPARALAGALGTRAVPLVAAALGLSLLAPPGATPSYAAVERAAVPTTRVVVADLPRGANPRVDVLVGRTLVHGGRARTVRLPGGGTPAYAFGTWRGVPLIGVTRRAGTQVYAVAPDGTATARGGVHYTYSEEPRLVRETGHVLFVVPDRAEPTTYTVLDASTGRQLLETTEVDDLDPGDRAVVEGQWMPPRWVTARSADGELEVAARNPYRSDPTLLTVRRTDDKRPLRRFAFPPYPSTRVTEWPDSVEAGRVVLERGSTLLALGYQRRTGRVAVVRCRVDGRCVRATSWAEAISIAGAGALGWSGPY